MKNKLSLTPPKREMPTPEEFVSSANRLPKTDNEPRPWEDPKVRPDVIKMVSLRMPEEYILRLQYISEKTNISQQELLRRVIVPWLEEEAEKY